MSGGADNPLGHWESRQLSDANERILVALGGSWWAPPMQPRDWAQTSVMRRLRSRLEKRFHRIYPTAPWVWKDPRTCLTFPVWSRIWSEGEPVVNVVLVRNPGEVSASISTRDGYPIPYALGLWERYMRMAIFNSASRPTLVVDYNSMVADASSFVSSVAADLEYLGVEVNPDRSAAISSLARPNGPRQPSPRRSNWRDFPPSEPQLRLLELLQGISGPHRSLSVPDFGVETPGLQRAFDRMRWQLPTSSSIGSLQYRLASSGRRFAAAALPARFLL